MKIIACSQLVYCLELGTALGHDEIAVAVRSYVRIQAGSKWLKVFMQTLNSKNFQSKLTSNC